MSSLPYSPEELNAPVCPICGIKHWARQEHRYHWSPKEVNIEATPALQNVGVMTPSVLTAIETGVGTIVAPSLFRRPVLHLKKKR